MRLLLVGTPTYRLARWVAGLTGLGWDTHVYPVFPQHVSIAAHPLFAGVTYWDATGSEMDRPEREFHVRRASVLHLPDWRAFFDRGPSDSRILAALIRRIQPDLMHSFELKPAGYLTLDARDRLGSTQTPYWIHTGYDDPSIPVGEPASHGSRIGRLMQALDLYVAECQDDLNVVERLGYAGPRQKVIPMSGGWDLVALEALRSPGPPSARRTVLLESDDRWQGPVSSTLEAIERVADVLRDYTLVLHHSSNRFLEGATRLGLRHGFAVEEVGRPGCESVPDELILTLHGQSRISIALGIRDGGAIAALEAMVMGSMPLQSNAGCRHEWIISGVNGLLIPPGDPRLVADGIRLAVTDDALVDEAAAANARIAHERLAYPIVHRQVVQMYEQAFARARERSAHHGTTVR